MATASAAKPAALKKGSPQARAAGAKTSAPSAGVRAAVPDKKPTVPKGVRLVAGKKTRTFKLTAEEVAYVKAFKARPPSFIAGYIETRAKRRGMLQALGLSKGKKQLSMLFETRAVACALGAPTGSGKGTSAFFPLYFGGWPSSTINHDPKRENAVGASGYRKYVLGNDQLFFEPLDKSGYSTRWNNMTECRWGVPEEIQDSKEQAAVYIDPRARRLEGGNDAHWLTAGIGACVGGMLYVAYMNDKPTPPSMVDVRNLFTDPRFADLKQLADFVIAQDHARGRKFYWTTDAEGKPVRQHPEIVRAFTRLKNGSPNEVESVRATLLTQLEMFADPIIAANTSVSDFSVTDLMNGERPIDLWLISPASKIGLVSAIFGALLATFLSRATERMDYDEHGNAIMPNKRMLCLVLDEMPQLPKLESLVKGIAVFRSFGVRLLFAFQTKSQLIGTYGEADTKTLLENCDIHLLQTPAGHDGAKEISEQLGNWTAVTDNLSESGEKSALVGMKGVSLSEQTQSVSLMTPQQVREMKDEYQIVMRKGLPPIYARKAFFYEHKYWPRFKAIPWPGRSDRIRRVPFSLDSQEFGQAAPVQVVQPAVKDAEVDLNKLPKFGADAVQDITPTTAPLAPARGDDALNGPFDYGALGMSENDVVNELVRRRSTRTVRKPAKPARQVETSTTAPPADAPVDPETGEVLYPTPNIAHGAEPPGSADPAEATDEASTAEAAEADGLQDMMKYV